MKHELKNAYIYMNVVMKTDENQVIKGNVNSLVQVVNNMISNAIQAYDGKHDQNIELTVNKKENNIKSKDNVIIIGNKDYIENTNRRIMQKNIENLTIIDCYKFEDICNNITELASNYNGNLNTNGIQK